MSEDYRRCISDQRLQKWCRHIRALRPESHSCVLPSVLLPTLALKIALALAVLSRAALESFKLWDRPAQQRRQEQRRRQWLQTHRRGQLWG